MNRLFLLDVVLFVVLPLMLFVMLVAFGLPAWKAAMGGFGLQFAMHLFAERFL